MIIIMIIILISILITPWVTPPTPPTVSLQRVVANLCLASMEAELLGIDHHVCEVELATAAFVRAQVRHDAKLEASCYNYNAKKL
jgi:hypothetical protein